MPAANGREDQKFHVTRASRFEDAELLGSRARQPISSGRWNGRRAWHVGKCLDPSTAPVSAPGSPNAPTGTLRYAGWAHQGLLSQSNRWPKGLGTARRKVPIPLRSCLASRSALGLARICIEGYKRPVRTKISRTISTSPHPPLG